MAQDKFKKKFKIVQNRHLLRRASFLAIWKFKHENLVVICLKIFR
jgi:hypothetical protein